jgi:hypothetical protein
MLTAQELRIGNWVYFLKYVPVQITAGHIVFIFDGDKDYSPIELSDSILAALGFKKYYDYLEVDGFKIAPVPEMSCYCLECEDHRLQVPFFRYIHQLQNLYFSMRHEELHITAEMLPLCKITARMPLK